MDDQFWTIDVESTFIGIICLLFLIIPSGEIFRKFSIERKILIRLSFYFFYKYHDSKRRKSSYISKDIGKV